MNASTGGLIGDGALTIRSTDGLVLDDSLSTSGTLTINVDTDFGDEMGTFTISSSATVSSGNNQIDITANDLALDGNLDSGSAATIVRDSDGSGIGLGDSAVTNGIHVDTSELSRFASGDLEWFSSGNVVIDNVTQPGSVTGRVAIDANGTSSTISLVNNASTFDSLELNASDGISLTIDLTTTGPLTIDADSDAGDQVGSLSLTAGIAIDSSNQDVVITANDIDFSGSLQAGTGTVTINDSDGSGIGLGDTPVTDGINLSGTELQNVSASDLNFQTSGSIIVDNLTATDTNSIGGTTGLVSSGSVTFSASGATFNALSVSADDRIAIDGQLATDSGNLFLDGDADDSADGNDDLTFAASVQVTSAGSLTISATTGGISGSGQLTLEAADGIAINDSLTTAGQLTLNSDTDPGDDDGLLSVASGVAIDTTNNLLDITTNDLSVSGSFDSGTAQTTIRDSDGDGIGLGNGTITDGLNLSNVDLQDFTATGLSLVTAGDVLIDGFTQAATVSGTTTLTSSQTITASGSGSSFNSLTANAEDGIAVFADLSTTIGDLALDGDSDDALDTSDDIQMGADIQIASAGLLSLEATTGDLHGQGNLNLQAVAGVTIDDSLTTAGALTINSDSDADGSGTLTVSAGATLDTNNQQMTLVVGDLDILGGADSGNRDDDNPGQRWCRNRPW